MKNDYLFFCQHCGMPQRISAYVIKYYFVLYGVNHFYCDNCKGINKVTEIERDQLQEELFEK